MTGYELNGLCKNDGELLLYAADLGMLLCAVMKKGRPFRFKARGSSMRPLIRNRDVLTVSPLLSGSISPGDVVAILIPDDGRLLVHRVIALDKGKVVVRGDSNHYMEGSFGLKDVVGKVTRVERAGRSVWFGRGRFGAVTAFLVRSGMMSGLILPLLDICKGGARALARRINASIGVTP